MTFSFLRLNTDWTSLTLCLGCMWSTSHDLKKPVSLYLFPNFFYSFTFLNVVQEKAENQKLILHNLRLSQVGPPPPGWETCLCHMADTRGSCDPGFFFPEGRFQAVVFPQMTFAEFDGRFVPMSDRPLPQGGLNRSVKRLKVFS